MWVDELLQSNTNNSYNPSYPKNGLLDVASVLDVLSGHNFAGDEWKGSIINQWQIVSQTFPLDIGGLFYSIFFVQKLYIVILKQVSFVLQNASQSSIHKEDTDVSGFHEEIRNDWHGQIGLKPQRNSGNNYINPHP